MSAKSFDPDSPILALDCSLGGCAVAVGRRDGDIAEEIFITEREQAAKLVPLINVVLARAGASYADIGLIVTTVGPGSFTGLRIGLSTARAFGFALGVPVQGVSTLEAMRLSCAKTGDADPQLIILDAKRRDYYAAAYAADGGEILAPSCMMPEDIVAFAGGKGFILSGDGVAKFMKASSEDGAKIFKELRERATINPAVLLNKGVADFLVNGDAARPEPVYLRGADVSISTKAQRTIAAI